MDLFNALLDSNAALLAGGVAGRSHRRAGRGSQDAYAWGRGPGTLAAAVADGCSAGRESGIGAGVGARVAAASAARHAAGGMALSEVPARVLGDVVAELARLARACSIDDATAGAFVADALLATLQACVLRGEECCVFGVGDGVVRVDERLLVLDEGDTPDYPAYALFPAMPAPRLRVHHLGPVTSGLVLGTDGCVELLARKDEALPDGTAIGGFDGPLTDARLLKNPSLLSKRLFAWAEHTGGPHDDCTLVVLRRVA